MFVVRFALLFFISIATVGVCNALPITGTQKQQPAANKLPVSSSLPVRTGYVNDFAHALDVGTRGRIEAALEELKKRSQIDFAIVIIDSTASQTISEYSGALAKEWKIDQGPGLLLLIATDDRRWRVEIANSLRPDLPEKRLREIGDLMGASLGRQRYAEGVRRFAVEAIKTLAAKRGFAPIDIPEPLLPG